MDSKVVLNYSKLQIPILNGSHSYVIMPALLSQIDSTQINTNFNHHHHHHQQSSQVQQQQQHMCHDDASSFTNLYFTSDSHNGNGINEEIQNHQQHEHQLIDSNILINQPNQLINTNKPSHKSASNKKSKKKLNKLNLTIVNDDDLQEQQETTQLLELNSPISISKFIFKEAENSMINNHDTQPIVTTQASPFESNETFSTDSIAIVGTNQQQQQQLEIEQDILNKNMQNNGDLSMNLNLSQDVNGVGENCNSNNDSITYIVNCPTLSEVELGHMMNCFIALNKLNDSNLGCMLKCSVCAEKFDNLNDLSNHKENDFCKDSSHCFLSDNENNIIDELCDGVGGNVLDDDEDDDAIDDEDDDLDLDLDIDDDLQIVQAMPKKKTRRKYVKHKYSAPSNLICEHCSKTCRTRAELLVHIHKHAGNEAECWECGKKCASFSNLVSHVQLHTGEKPYTCQFCGKQFTQDAHLTRHLRLHTGERPFVCNTCGKTYKDYSYYKTHERIHRGERLYKCNYCNKEYYDASYYKKHIRLHTGEKPYMCPVCGKQFHRSDYLKLHSFSHTDERPFYCHICGKGFKMNYNLKIHLKNHETENQLRDKTLTINQLMDENESESQHHGDLTANEINALLLDNGQNYKIDAMTFNLITEKESQASQINNLLSIASDASQIRTTDLDSMALNFT